jgi:hypothetical protein
MNTNDILFASVDLPILDKQSSTDKILKIDSTYWFWNSFRATSMLPLMTKNADGGETGTQNHRNGAYEWLEYTPIEIINWFEDCVFPWMGQKTRILALMTKPDFKNNEHIDCSLNEVGTRQHKFRIVLKGNTDTLYFKTTSGDISAPNTELPFIMDGCWPHGMYNYTDEIKITIAAGAPWTGNDYYNNITVNLKKSDYVLPENIIQYAKTDTK